MKRYISKKNLNRLGIWIRCQFELESMVANSITLYRHNLQPLWKSINHTLLLTCILHTKQSAIPCAWYVLFQVLGYLLRHIRRMKPIVL